jgi:NitT/TauT family transport system substrate-binding protein
MTISRRSLLLSPLLAAAPVMPARAGSAIRVGTLRYGTVGWELDVMRTHGFDTDAGVTVAPVEFAAAQATQVALQAGGVDVIFIDWLWVSRQRGSGADWTFAPGSSAVGAVVAPVDSPIRSVTDLTGRRLGIAGSPLDKSWLLLRAYTSKQFGLDLDAQVEKTFGPPPLLAEQLRAGRLDAVLTYWPFVARAEAAGMRRVVTVDDAITGLGIPAGLPFVGWTFSRDWAASNRPAVQAFLAASSRARTLLGASDAEWDRIAPITGAANPAELSQLKAWYRRGIPGAWGRPEQDAAARLYDILAAIGGPALVGAAPHLFPGTFWQAADVPPG